ncbi:3-carboxy-cis,cis-mucoante lactonizing enzyme [Setomelanomma holmii]|uniref:3-carboxy-cis,cis-mucoante lactonizing enzyme n=1 Tax=Setomelanomma holmii TaxID=210430 RepID=A0A9P4LNI7_9PLEO|nr:3-carboxy-cis,cis-mucoante lactonizing enzyme [Setomelanomma holmii]
MPRLSTLSLAAALASPIIADSHYFNSGFFSGSTIVGVEFDDTTNALTLKQNISTKASSGSKWIALDQQKKNLYVGTTGAFQSYAITGNGSLEYSSEVALSSACSNANFITAASTSPYTVFGTAYGTGCPTEAIMVDADGVLHSNTANFTYSNSSGVHGTDLSRDNAFLYSADDMGNAVWVHSLDATTGAAEELQYLAAPSGANPRHLAVHPNGLWVYVIYEEANQLAVYKRDNETGLLTDINSTYLLLPESFTNSTSYWSDEVKFSIPSSSTTNTTSPAYLITGTRSHSTNATGFVSGFILDPSTGAISSQSFLLPTTASGGSANAVAPAPFDERYFAITDSAASTIEMWRIDENGLGAESVARLGLGNGPANVVWVS